MTRDKKCWWDGDGMEWGGIERAVMVSAGMIGSVMGTIRFLPIIKLWGIGNMMAHDVCTIIPC